MERFVRGGRADASGAGTVESPRLNSELLEMRQQEILHGLDALQATAHQLLEQATTIMGAEHDDKQSDAAGQPVSHVPLTA